MQPTVTKWGLKDDKIQAWVSMLLTENSQNVLENWIL